MSTAHLTPPVDTRSHATSPSDFTGWFLGVEEQIDTTNRLAARLPAWHAIRADTQTAGRGRTGRAWTSDRGGLWLSAVLPCPGPRDRWALLPLAVGWTLLNTLRDLGVSGIRLRWPNDLLVGDRKLAGLLVERHNADTAVVGIGLNVLNSPERAAPELRDTTTRLADLIDLHHRDLDDLSALVLHAVAEAWEALLAGEFPRIADDLNQSWSKPRLVELTVAGHAAPIVGNFLGIDAAGHLRLRASDGTLLTYDSTQVALLREL